mmetsp:Transcript_35529/g.84303  ORF Transcript_35529/g.84303 Transcript_35529/m.84303 type:complete len:230 (+) Transcript_35529:1928-2617(+)
MLPQPTLPGDADGGGRAPPARVGHLRRPHQRVQGSEYPRQHEVVHQHRGVRDHPAGVDQGLCHLRVAVEVRHARADGGRGRGRNRRPGLPPQGAARVLREASREAKEHGPPLPPLLPHQPAARCDGDEQVRGLLLRAQPRLPRPCLPYPASPQPPRQRYLPRPPQVCGEEGAGPQGTLLDEGAPGKPVWQKQNQLPRPRCVDGRADAPRHPHCPRAAVRRGASVVAARG